MPAKHKILVVDDEPDTLELLRFNLTQAGFDVITADTGTEAITKVRQYQPDLIVLDLMLPEVDGLEVFKILRRNQATASIPVIMLTAKAAEFDRVLGLELGADDYVTKPFSVRELVLRIKKLLAQPVQTDSAQELIQVGQLTIDTARYLVKYAGKPVRLTATEFKLLVLLAQRRGRVQTRETLLEEVWGYNPDMDTRTVDTHVHRLREKLGPAGACIETVRGVGYRFVESPGRS